MPLRACKPVVTVTARSSAAATTIARVRTIHQPFTANSAATRQPNYVTDANLEHVLSFILKAPY